MMRCWMFLLLVAVLCGLSHAQATEERRVPDNEGGVLYLSLAPELSYDETATYRGLSATPPPSQAIVTSEPSDVPQIAFILAAFPPKARPEVRLVSFGIRYPEGIHVIRSGATRRGMHTFTRDWPLSTEGMMIGPTGEPDTARVVEMGWIAIRADGPGILELVPHPDSRMGARIVASSPPVQVPVAALGSLGFGMPGRAPEPLEASPPLGAACIPDSLCIEVSRAEADYYATRYEESGGLLYLGDGVGCREGPCRSDSPTGACCPAAGGCEILSARDCAALGGRYHGADSVCSPDPCQKEGTTDPESEAGEP